MDFLQILGSGSALPVKNRNPSGQVIKDNERYFLIDCGEGTQLQLRAHKISFARINHIFISHLHGDHFFGLPGLLSTFHLLGRKAELNLYAPEGIKSILENIFNHSKTFLNYPIVYHQLNPIGRNLIFEDPKITVESIPLNHKISCFGYIFSEKPKMKKLIPAMIEKYNIPPQVRKLIKLGNDFNTGSEIISNDLLTFNSGKKPLKFAYCSDNRVKPNTKDLIGNADFLYHETTFMESEKEKAIKTFHSTALEAAQLASSIGARTLIMGHYSARYQDLSGLHQEATLEFPNCILGADGLKIPFHEETVGFEE